MKIISGIYIVVFICGTFGFTHEVNEASYRIYQKESTVVIEAEFPWTIRHALLKFNPSLEHSNDKKDFENTFVEYVRNNLILKDKNGDLFEFEEYQELENNGHTHQNNFLIIFNGTNLYEVTNTIMFNVYKNQINYNTISINSNKKTFKTSIETTSFTLSENKNTKNRYFLFLFLPVSYIFYKFLNKKTTTRKI